MRLSLMWKGRKIDANTEKKKDKTEGKEEKQIKRLLLTVLEPDDAGG